MPVLTEVITYYNSEEEPPRDLESIRLTAETVKYLQNFGIGSFDLLLQGCSTVGRRRKRKRYCELANYFILIKVKGIWRTF